MRISKVEYSRIDGKRGPDIRSALRSSGNQNGIPAFMTDRLPSGIVCLGFWAVMIAAAMWLRPLLPMAETRFAAVAWEMWVHDSFIVPLLNGEAYSHKPPLVFWIVHLGWSVLGVNETWLRLVSPLFALASLTMTCKLGCLLWPERSSAAILGTLVFLGSVPFVIYAPLTMFDMPVVFFTLLAISSIVRACRLGTVRTLVVGGGIALGLGVLSKGPIIFVYVLPVALSAPWWSGGRVAVPWPRWYLGLGGAVVLGAAIALAWALPAACAGGPAYAKAILWSQTSGRLVDSFAHARPIWWYAAILPVIMLPWLAWPRLWHAARNRTLWRDPGVRLCVAWLLPAIVLLSLISGKQMHYLLPLLPAASLVAGLGAELRTCGSGREGLFAGAGFLGIGLLTAAGAGGFLPASWPADVGANPDRSPEDLVTWLAPGLILAGLGTAVAMRRFRSPIATAKALAGLMVFLFVVVNVYWDRFLGGMYDVRPSSRYLAELERKGYSLAQLGMYKLRGQYHFYGRMEKPVTVLEKGHLKTWLGDHPDGRVLIFVRHLPETVTGPEHATRFRGRYLTVWSPGQIAVNPGLSSVE